MAINFKYITSFYMVMMSLCFFNDHTMAQKKISQLANGTFRVIARDTGVFKKVSQYADGSKMTDAKADGIVYAKIQGQYVKREIANGIDLNWYNIRAKNETAKKNSMDSAIRMANLLALPVYVPKGNLDILPNQTPKKGFSGQGTIKYKGAYIYRPKAEYIGIPQNLNENKYTYPNVLKDGDLIEPPLARKPQNVAGLDVLAHWYNDFGLSRTALSSNQANGAYTWYDWSWNHTSKANYDPSRHPLLGWYRGDDVKVLDWITYWLVKYGVDGVIIDQTFSTKNWSSPKDKGYWIYQLFNKVKNFKQLKYTVWLYSKHGMAASTARQGDSDMINNVLAKYKNVYCYEKGTKRYPTFYVWDMEGTRGIYDRYKGVKNTVQYLKSLAAQCKSLGYDGICIYARNLSDKEALFGKNVRKDLEDNGVILFSQDYSTSYQKTKNAYQSSFAAYARNVQFPVASDQILNVLTSAQTQKPHPSNWKLAGSTPQLFGEVLKKAVDVTMSSNKPKTVVVYNVSEWAEAGPGLIPNQKDLFGYLEAVLKIKTEK